MLQRYIGDRGFYRRAMVIALPIVIQNAITSLVSLLDNIMVGQVGTLQMSGTSIVNQLLFIFMLAVFGANAGAGIFTAQFFGNHDEEGIRHTFRFKLIICLLLTLLCCGIFLLFDDALIGLYLQGEGAAEDAAAVLGYGKEYLYIMLWGLLPFALSNAYSGTLRETGQTFIPMVGSITAVLINLVLNYTLIFGHFGAPAMGARGAALATVISRFAELAVVAGWTHLNPKKNPFIRSAFRSLYVPGKLLVSIIRKGTPLLINETLFAIGLAAANQSYSTCGLDVVPALNICSTVFNLSGVTYMAMGNAVGIIMGQMMGAGSPKEEIRDTNNKLTALTIASGIVFAVLTAGCAYLFPMLYNTSDEVRSLAGTLILIDALMIPAYAYVHAAYFSFRAGGKTFITFLFDCGFLWVLTVPCAYILCRYTSLDIITLYLICQSIQYIKAFSGMLMLKNDFWIQNLAQNNQS